MLVVDDGSVIVVVEIVSGSDVGSLLLVVSVISMSGSGHFEEFVGCVPGTVQLNLPVVKHAYISVI